MKKVLIILGFLSASVVSFSQEFSDPSRTEWRTDAGQQGAKSGFFQGDGGAQNSNYPANASGWWHLLDVRHTNTVNNYAMQFAGSFFDQSLYFRKTNNNPSQPWSRVLLETDRSITIGEPNDPMGLTSGSYAIKFYGFRDIVPNAISAKIAAERTNSCCGYLSQGTDLVFYTVRELNQANADNSIERMRIKDDGNIFMKGSLTIEDGGGYLVGGSFNAGVDGLVTNGGNKHTIIAGQEVRINAPVLLTKKVKVSINAADWADYVFASNYHLRSLTSLEGFIKQFKHLPDVPSAADVQKNDLDLGGTQAVLLRKVEELTLYLIEQDKVNHKQQELIKRQQKAVDVLQRKINRLKH